MKSGGTKTDKLEKFMWRIGVFSFLYTVPAIIVIACLTHEQAYFDYWMLGWQQNKCTDPKWNGTIHCPFPRSSFHSMLTYPKPEFILFMIKHLMMLIVGISSGFWVWSSKTLATWTNFYRRIFGMKPEVYV